MSIILTFIGRFYTLLTADIIMNTQISILKFKDYLIKYNFDVNASQNRNKLKTRYSKLVVVVVVIIQVKTSLKLISSRN